MKNKQIKSAQFFKLNVLQESHLKLYKLVCVLLFTRTDCHSRNNLDRLRVV